MARYTDYCTCFYDESSSEVWFYDEITDKIIRKQKVGNSIEAETVMNAWVSNAPRHVICDKL